MKIWLSYLKVRRWHLQALFIITGLIRTFIKPMCMGTWGEGVKVYSISHI